MWRVSLSPSFVCRVTHSGMFSSALCRHIFLPVARKYGLICCPCWARIFHLVICIVPLWWPPPLPPLICLSFFPSLLLLCCIFSASGLLFLYPQAVTFIFWFGFFLLDTISKQDKSNLFFKYEWRHRFSDFSPFAYCQKDLASWLILSAVWAFKCFINLEHRPSWLCVACLLGARFCLSNWCLLSK